MKTIKFRPLLYAALLFIVTMSCKVDVLNKPTITNTTPPGVVSNVNVLNQNGKATLTYTIPSNEDLSYIKAVYEIKPGVVLEVKASYYTNTMILSGYSDTLPHIVKLYAVNSSEVMSAPTSVTVNPLTPSIKLAFKSLTVIPAFGGFTVNCSNPFKDNISIITMVDTIGKGVYVQTIGMNNIYSSALVISNTTRSQPAIPRKYAFMIRDRWLNQTDTLFQTLTPIFEMQIPTTNPTWSNGAIPGDTPCKSGSNADIKYIMDGKVEGWSNIYFGDESAGAPTALTINFNKAYKLSRCLISNYKDFQGWFGRGTIRNFEIYGSNTPGPTGAFNDGTWDLLAKVNIVKPSGSPLGTETAEDAIAGKAFAVDFPAGMIAYKYIRLKNYSNWQGSYFMAIAEISFWGSN